MNIINKIEDVLISGILNKNLTVVPNKGASIEEINKEEKSLSRVFSQQHRNLLKKWNGIDLEVISFYGCNEPEDTLECLRNNQELLPSAISKRIIIGSDPAGFIYIEDESGKFFLLDTDGGEIAEIASSIEDLICNYVFGKRAKEFGGEEWEQELRDNKLI